MTRRTTKLPIILAALAALIALAAILFLSARQRTTVTGPLPEDAAQRLVRPDSPVLGAEDAPVTVVEFFDPECEACRAVEPDVMALLDKYDGKVRLVARYFPLHANSVAAAGLIEAAAQEEEWKRWRAREYLFTKQPEWGEQQTSQADLFLRYAEDLGLDVEHARKVMDSAEVRDRVERDRQDGVALGVSGTPTFFVNGEPLKELSMPALEAAIEQALP
ncbi:DsbA family protein [Deinococcus enclensis]|uniref:Protein-disulfide isomerase n=1 Tax=Deinococcus enclensis TaxID=1049582 RepID=A0ABT9MG05_9DEIO|nr:DsbA family protein [Deinococcus enclensis]MDP9765525.1 protein-disulfide isomerase [Deinococcus enclensis]